MIFYSMEKKAKKGEISGVRKASDFPSNAT